MPTYKTMLRWMNEGARHVKKSPSRLDAPTRSDAIKRAREGASDPPLLAAAPLAEHAAKIAAARAAHRSWEAIPDICSPPVKS
jgi:hypothetical protein